jgi:hypothetical protein
MKAGDDMKTSRVITIVGLVGVVFACNPPNNCEILVSIQATCLGRDPGLSYESSCLWYGDNTDEYCVAEAHKCYIDTFNCDEFRIHVETDSPYTADDACDEEHLGKCGSGTI